MLDRYRTGSPTITENIAFHKPPTKTADKVTEKRKEMKIFLKSWQASWNERMK